MARVFLVQNPSRRDPYSGEWVPKFDLSPAVRFGEIVEILPPGPDYHDPDALAARLRQCLADYEAGDFLLALGDPIAIGLSIHMALVAAGEVTVLKYDRGERAYAPVRLCRRPQNRASPNGHA